MFCGKQVVYESNHIIRKSGDRGGSIREAEPERDRRKDPQESSSCVGGVETEQYKDKRDPSPRKRLPKCHGMQEAGIMRRRVLPEAVCSLPKCGLPNGLPRIQQFTLYSAAAAAVCLQCVRQPKKVQGASNLLNSISLNLNSVKGVLVKTAVSPN